MEKGKLTEKQLEVFNYIKEHIQDKGYPPTVREICKKTNLSSTSSVHAHLSKLDNLGYIRRDPSKPRAIEILDDDFTATPNKDLINVPIVGTVAAGEPIFAEQNITNYFPIPSEYLSNTQTFMLVVQGESMVNVGICNGDYLVAEKTQTAKNGEIVVALIEDSATVKTFYKEDGHIRLQPENDFMDPIIVNDTEVQILGKVIGVFRFFNK